MREIEEALRLSKLAEERLGRGRGISAAAATQALEMLGAAPDDAGGLLVVIRLETDELGDVPDLNVIGNGGYEPLVWTVWLDEPLGYHGLRALGTGEALPDLPAGHASLVRHAEGGAEAAAAAEVRRRLPPSLPRAHSSVAVVMSARAVGLVSGICAGAENSVA